MDLEQRLRASLVAPDPGAVFTARVMARVGRGAARRRSRFIVIGTVLVVGAAAAMLAWRMSVVQSPVEAEVVVVDPGPVAAEPDVQAAPEVKEPVASAPQAVTPEDNAPRYSVLVMPLRQEDQDLSKRNLVEALHAAMLNELRKVPGLTLQVPGESAPGSGGRADYLLTLTSLATTVSPAGSVMVLATDGTSRCARNGSTGMPCGSNSPQGPFFPIGGSSSTNYSYASNGPVVIDTFTGAGSAGTDDVVWVELKVESPGPSTARFTWPVASAGMSEQRFCIGGNGLPSECPSPERMAAQYIQSLRLQVFPPDPAYQQRMIAQLRNAGRDLDGGLKLQDLLQGLVREGGANMDAGTVQALVKFAAGQPADTRASIWSTLRRASNPLLIPPLVESLRHDPDRPVRLVALSSLASNYSNDPDVRRALEDVGAKDEDVIVRATVRRALYGPAQWHDDVLAALNDVELPYEARLAPLLASTTSVLPREGFESSGVRQAVLREQQVLSPLVALIQEHVRDSEHANETANALGLLTGIDDPAVFDLFLTLAREGSLPIAMTGPVGTWALNHQNDPRVREILPAIEPMIPPQLLQRMKQVTESAGVTTLGEESPVYGTGSGAIVIRTPAAQ